MTRMTTAHTIESIQALINNHQDDLSELCYLLEDCTGAEMTNRLIPGDDNFEYPEWTERAEINGIPVVVTYRTTPEDQEIVNESGDWGDINWDERVTDITVDHDAIEY